MGRRSWVVVVVVDGLSATSLKVRGIFRVALLG